MLDEKPRTVFHIGTGARILVAVLGLCGWAFLAFAVYLIYSGALWDMLADGYPYDAVIGAVVFSLWLCFIDSDRHGNRRRWVIPK